MGNQTRRKCTRCQEMKWPNSFNANPTLCYQCFKEVNAPKKRELKCLSCGVLKSIPMPNRMCDQCKRSHDYSEDIFTQEYSIVM